MSDEIPRGEMMAKAKPKQPGQPKQARPKVIVSPFEILIDSREQNPYTFDGIQAGADQGYAWIDVRTQRVGLPFGMGDYSIMGYPGIGIERKSKSDLYSSISTRRENFEARLSAMCERSYAAVVVEAEISDLLTHPPVFTAYSPKSLFRTIQAWSVRYRGVAWWFMPGREFGERLVFRLLDRFWRDRQGV